MKTRGEGLSPGHVWWVLPVALLSPLAAIAIVSWASVPSRQDAEQSVALTIGQREGTTVTATCDEPDSGGITCRLRDDEGRYGWAAGISYSDLDLDGSGSDRRISSYYDFPISSDGIVDRELELHPELELDVALFAVALEALRSVDGGFPEPFDCPDVAIGDAVTCTASAPIPAAQVQRTAADRYRIMFTVPLPPG